MKNWSECKNFKNFYSFLFPSFSSEKKKKTLDIINGKFDFMFFFSRKKEKGGAKVKLK